MWGKRPLRSPTSGEATGMKSSRVRYSPPTAGSLLTSRSETVSPSSW